MSTGYKRGKTKYPGVFYVSRKGERFIYIFYRMPGSPKQIEEKLGSVTAGWTPARANQERLRRIAGKSQSNTEKRQAEINRPTFLRLWESYLECKGDEVRGLVQDKNRFKTHVAPALGDKIPAELVPLDLERLRKQVVKTHSTGTVRNVLELIRRLINHGTKMRLCGPLDWTVELPAVDPNAERIEVLTQEQFRSLNEVWQNYPDRQIARFHQFVGWSGMRPSEPFKLRWSDIDFKNGFLIKRNTKSGKKVELFMNDSVREILLNKRRFLDRSAQPMRESEFVFPTEQGNQRSRDSYQRHFRAIRDAAGIPSSYRPNYCLRDTLASMMLSGGASLEEVGYQLGHEAGSPMTRRYAKFVKDAQLAIVNKSQKALQQMLNQVTEVDILDRQQANA